jgi:hypothetical protein
VLVCQFLAELGIGAENPGVYNGKWGGSGRCDATTGLSIVL